MTKSYVAVQKLKECFERQEKVLGQQVQRLGKDNDQRTNTTPQKTKPKSSN